MKLRVLDRFRKCISCNAEDIFIHPADDFGVVLCHCNACGNKWGQ